MRDDKGVDDKVLCVPLHDPNWNTVEELEDIPQSLRDEISHFFSIYKQPEGKTVKVDGWFPREDAMAAIEAARERYLDSVSSGTESAGSSPGSERDARSS
jgi:inorganic pyrophosphatase